MTIWHILVGALVLIASLLVVVVVLFQQGHRQGINGAISGGADTFLSKTKARTLDEKLSRFTKYIAIAFFALVFLANVIAALL